MLASISAAFTYEPDITLPSLDSLYISIENDILDETILRQENHENALWVARTMLTEDVKEDVWELIGSIIINRTDMCYNDKCTIYDVIHDRKQFTAVNTRKWRRTYSKLNTGHSEEFDTAYNLALNLLTRGIPEKYDSITHTYYVPAMKSLYRKSYPRWDTPDNPMNNRSELNGWVYGTANEYYGNPTLNEETSNG